MHLDGLYALAAGGGFGAAALFAQVGGTPDALGWVAQLGPAAGAAVVAFVAFRYVGKRDDDAKSAMDRQEKQAAEDRAAVSKLFDRVEGMGKENRDALERVVGRMELMIRDNAQAHSNGLAQVSGSIQMMINTVTSFQKTQDAVLADVAAMKEDVAVLTRLAGLRPDDDQPDPTRSDSKQVRIPKRLPKHDGGG